MTHAQLTEKINLLGYQGFKEAYQRQSEDIAYTKMSFEERIYQLLGAQEIFLKNKRITMNHRLSKIKDKQAALDAIDYRPDRRIDKAQIQSLSQLNFIESKQNIIITGKTGTGKSYLAQALANRAIYDGIKVYYVRTPSLLEEIRISRIDGTYTNLLKKYSRFKLLILDDFGVAPMVDDDATNLFEIIEDRSTINSTIITSQLPVSEWYGYLNNNTIADAILDRIVYSSHRIELEGESMRKINSIAENTTY
ncbi:MAG: transposase [Sulfurovum sp.]|nr:MAG: transposase [Sulfurovum sp.]